VQGRSLHMDTSERWYALGAWILLCACFDRLVLYQFAFYFLWDLAGTFRD
jgi:hypothetical protein